MRRRLTYANVMSTIAAFVALGGGAYAAASSIPGPGGVIHSCYQTRKGALRVVPAGKKCAKGEKVLVFNQRGPQGLPGLPGTPGAVGVKGEQGPQGPGATTFSTTLPQGSGFVQLATLKNGILLEGACKTGKVWIELQTSHSPDPIEIVGTSVEGEKPYTENRNIFQSETVANPEIVAFDVAVRDASVGPAARVTVQGTYGSPCQFWGMITPSS